MAEGIKDNECKYLCIYYIFVCSFFLFCGCVCEWYTCIISTKQNQYHSEIDKLGTKQCLKRATSHVENTKTSCTFDHFLLIIKS